MSSKFCVKQGICETPTRATTVLWTSEPESVPQTQRGMSPGQKKRTEERLYVRLYMLQNLYECLYVRSYVLPNSHVGSSVLPNSYVRSYVCLYVLPNLYLHLYVEKQN